MQTMSSICVKDMAILWIKAVSNRKTFNERIETLVLSRICVYVLSNTVVSWPFKHYYHYE